MNFISELTPHFIPLSALLLSLILTPVNFSGGGGGGEGIEGMESGDGAGKDGDGDIGGGLKRGVRKDGEIRGEVGEGRGMGEGQTGLLQRDETVGVQEGGRGESEGGTTEGVSDLERRLEKIGVTVVAREGDGGGVSKGENGSGGGGAREEGTRLEHGSEEVEKVVEERVGINEGGGEVVEERVGINEEGEVGEGRVETGGMGEEGWSERRIREIGEIEGAGKRETETGSEGGERKEEGRTSRSSLPFGLHRSDPDNVCLQARHFSDQQLQSPEGQRRANNDTLTTTMMTATATTTTMATMRSVEEEILAHSNRFVININATKYIPGQTLTVTVSSPIPYRGFLLQARRYGSPVVVGSFPNPPSSESASNDTDDLVFFNCDGLSDTILAWLPRTVANLSTVWLPSSEDFGLIQFVATIFVSEIDFRSNVTSKVFRKGFRRIELDGCGKLKGCFRYLNEGSDTCDADTCQYLVTYQVLDTEAQFELSAVADWVSIAFSSDERMGGDDVFMCVRNRWSVDVRRYVTEVGYQTPIEKDINPLYDVQGEVGEEDRVSCRFRRPLKVTHDSEDQFSIDLNNNWFQLYAWGPISASGGITRHSLDRPPTSQTKLSLRPTRNEFMTGSGSQPVRPSLATFLLLATATATATAAMLQLLLPSHQQL